MSATMPHGRKSLSAAQMFRELARIHVRAQRAAVAAFGSNAQCTILTELGRADSLSMGELAARLRLDKGWVSRGIDQMVDDGTVLRAADPADGRAVVLTLTAKGRKQHRELDRLLDAQIERVFSALSATDRAKVHTGLRILFGAYSNAVTSPTR
jgi:DNA-binding MarR family transcriptional regulator